jgi:hypothetical protein
MLVSVLELQEGDRLPLMADAVVDTVVPRDEHTVSVTFKDPVFSLLTQNPRGGILFFVTDKVHAMRGES